MQWSAKIDPKSQESDLDKLNVIHVAGTKGKGSTCAFVNSFLAAHWEGIEIPKQIGLYTSPHMRYIQERIQINSRPVSEDLFASAVLEVWDRLKNHSPEKPRFLQLLLLVAIHIFISQKVDVAIIETHNGGEFDATNVISKPVVTGISTIGMDHVKQLGPSIKDIAWHKAGIFKTGTPAFSVPQQPEVTAILQDRASERGVKLQFISPDPTLPIGAAALQPRVQRTNASLALALTRSFLTTKGAQPRTELIPKEIVTGIERFSWPGRFQEITQGNHQWFLDGAHNEISVQNAALWFAGAISRQQR